MQTFEKAEQAVDPQSIVHVALLDGDGTVIIHEEVPAADAGLRHHMLELQAELDVRDIPDASRQVYAGEAWPPEGHTEKAGVVTPVKAKP
jgi:hypothetical protein